MAGNTEIEKPKQEPKANLVMTRRGFEPTDMESAYRLAKAMAQSSIVTPQYRNNDANCLILLDMAMRMDVPWMMLMQHLYVVHERPALDATISTALVNRSGIFNDPLEYEVEGKNPKDPTYRVRAYATRASTGKVLYGPWIDWTLVKGEGWDKKPGSKWMTMPDQMFHYRAASWFQRRYCPELTMGMLTTDEAEDVGARKHVDSITYDEAKEQVQEDIKENMGSEPVNVEGQDLHDKAQQQKQQLAATEGKRGRRAGKKGAEPAQEPAPPAEAEQPEFMDGEGAPPEAKFVCKGKCGSVFDEPDEKPKPGGGMYYCCPNCGSLNFDGVEGAAAVA